MLITDTCPRHAVFNCIFKRNFCYDAAFFLAALRGFAGVSAASDTAAGFEDADEARFKRAFMDLLFLETPYEPIQRLPFFDFLSPFPISFTFCASIRTIGEIQN